MATVKVLVLKHQKKEDGTWNVKIRVSHRNATSYIPTEYYVTEELINKKDFTLRERNNPVFDQCMKDLLRVRHIMTEMGTSVNFYTAKELASYLKERLKGIAVELDFIDFARSYADRILSEGRERGRVYKTMCRHLVEYTGRKHIPFQEITSNFLTRFEAYLLSKNNANGTGKIGTEGVRLYMQCIHSIFNFAKREFNDEDKGIIRISNNPFARYTMPRRRETKRKDLGVEMIRKIFAFTSDDPKALMARDVFLISFMLCGTNLVDLYRMPPVRDGRVEYCRSKTKKFRLDDAFISMKVQPELEPYMERYRDSVGDRAFNFFTCYCGAYNFSTRMGQHLKKVGKEIGVENITMYAARHTFATIARNECEFSMDDVARALNHASMYRITDVYIRKDFSVVDRVCRAVLDLVLYDKRRE